MEKPLADIIEAVESALANTPGILDTKWLGETERQGVQKLEDALEKEGRGLAGACRNRGVMEVLERRQVCAVLNNNEFRHASEPALAWVAGDLIIGEEICDQKKSEGEVRLERRGFGSGHDPDRVRHRLNPWSFVQCCFRFSRLWRRPTRSRPVGRP